VLHLHLASLDLHLLLGAALGYLLLRKMNVLLDLAGENLRCDLLVAVFVFVASYLFNWLQCRKIIR